MSSLRCVQIRKEGQLTATVLKLVMDSACCGLNVTATAALGDANVCRQAVVHCTGP